MWIRTQNRQRIVNTDQVIDIFVDRTGMLVLAEVPRATIDQGTSLITLGEYKNRDTCLEILDYIHSIIGTKMPGIIMPLGGDVENWKESIEELAKAYIAQDFRR